MSVHVFAPAKINLTLQVGRSQADGYHPLQSAVMFADAGDWLEAAPADELSLSITGPFAGALDAHDNLVLRAARLLDAKRGAALRLKKKLPVASGIGGGSSDAAAALNALNALWGLGYSGFELARIATSLGADVPVCVAARTAWMSGAGETFAFMHAPQLDAVLVNPLKPLATGEVYRRFDAMGLGADFAPAAPPRWNSRTEALAAIAAIGNALAAPARALMPEIDEIGAVLRADPRVLYAGLSGSGATCFALVRDRPAADAFAADLAAQKRDWWIRPTTLGAS